jgi:carbon starvation protein CstA
VVHRNTESGRAAGSTIVVVILVIIAVLAIIAAILYFTEPAKSLPSILGTITRPASRARDHRPARGGIALVVGLICLVAAGYVGWRGRSSRGGAAA